MVGGGLQNEDENKQVTTKHCFKPNTELSSLFKRSMRMISLFKTKNLAELTAQNIDEDGLVVYNQTLS